MAVSSLHCTREGDSIAVIWAWDMKQKSAQIMVTRLLNGEEVASMEVGQILYQQAINTPHHGPTMRVPPEPLRITVKDGDNEQTVDLIDMHYTVEWRLKKRKIYQKKRFFGQELKGTEIRLQLKFPYKGQVPNDLFYYVLVGPGGKPREGDPVGYLPALRPGLNEYGVISPGGRTIQLCCNPDNQEVSRLFDFQQRPDLEE